MPRSVNSVAPRQEGKSIKTSQRLRRKTIPAKNAVEKGLQYAYRDRRQKEKLQSTLIQRINAGALHRMSFEFMGKISDKGILLNRKTLADLTWRKPLLIQCINY